MSEQPDDRGSQPRQRLRNETDLTREELGDRADYVGPPASIDQPAVKSAKATSIVGKGEDIIVQPLARHKRGDDYRGIVGLRIFAGDSDIQIELPVIDAAVLASDLEDAIDESLKKAEDMATRPNAIDLFEKEEK